MAVRRRRSRLGYSQEELANRAGLHRTYVADIERGARNPSLKALNGLATALSIPLHRLLDPSEGEVAPIEILLVEDDPRDVEWTLRAFRCGKVNNQVTVARDGERALELLQQDEALFQLVLLDLRLPGLSGFEVLRRLKADPRTASLRIVVLTGSSYARDVEVCRRLGVDAYLVKPVDPESLFRITSALDLSWSLLKGAPRTA